MDELWVLKRIKRHLEHHWKKTKDDSDRTQLTTVIKTYLMVIKVVKHHYLSTLIVPTVCCLAALFRITPSLLGKGA